MVTDRVIGKAMRAIRHSLLIFLIALAAGLLVNKFRSDGLPLSEDWSSEAMLVSDSGESMTISLEEARALCLDKKAIFLDARSPEDYARGHILYARNIPWQSFNDFIGRVWEDIPEDALIVTYCDGESCSLSKELAKELISMGYKKVRVLVNGWTRLSH